MGSRTSGGAAGAHDHIAVANGLPATRGDDRQARGQGLSDQPRTRHAELLHEQVEIRQMAAGEGELHPAIKRLPIVGDGG